MAAISSYARLTEERCSHAEGSVVHMPRSTDRQTEDISVRSGSTGAQLWFQPSLFLVTFFSWHSIAGSVAVGGCKQSPKKNRKKLVSLQVQPKRRGRGAEEADGDTVIGAGSTCAAQAGRQALPRPARTTQLPADDAVSLARRRLWCPDAVSPWTTVECGRWP